MIKRFIAWLREPAPRPETFTDHLDRLRLPLPPRL